jgi:hypothetical protein
VAVQALAQLVGSGVAGASRWDDQTALRLYDYFAQNKIGNGVAGVEAYNKSVDDRVAAIDAQIAAAQAAGPQFDSSRLKAMRDEAINQAITSSPVYAILQAGTGDYKGAGVSGLTFLPWGKVFKVGATLVRGALRDAANTSTRAAADALEQAARHPGAIGDVPRISQSGLPSDAAQALRDIQSGGIHPMSKGRNPSATMGEMQV